MTVRVGREFSKHQVLLERCSPSIAFPAALLDLHYARSCSSLVSDNSERKVQLYGDDIEIYYVHDRDNCAEVTTALKHSFEGQRNGV